MFNVKEPSRWTLPAILVAATLARLTLLGYESYWFDEIWAVKQVRYSFGGLLDSLAQQDVHPPLYPALLWGWVRLFGEAEAATRMLSALAGIGSVGLLYLIGRDLYDRRTGLVAAAILAVSPFVVDYAQESRAYSLLLFLSLVAYWRLLCWVQATPETRRRHFVYYVLAAVPLAYAHVFGSFVLLAQGVWVLWTQPALRKGMILAGVVVLVAFTPWIQVMLGQIEHVQGGFWIPELKLTDPVKWLWYWAGYSIPLTVAYALLLAYGARGAGSMVGLWIAIPLAVPIGLSLVGQPIFHQKYAIAVEGAFALVCARGLLRVQGPRQRLVVGVFALLLLAGLVDRQIVRNKEQYRELSAAADHAVTQGKVVCADEGTQPYLSYYMSQAARVHWIKSGDELTAIRTSANARGVELVYLAIHPAASAFADQLGTADETVELYAAKAWIYRPAQRQANTR